MRCAPNASLFSVFTSLTLLACASSALPQFKPNRSDQDLNAIGHRNIGGGVNFFSREKELALGKQLAQEVKRSSKMIDDPVVSTPSAPGANPERPILRKPGETTKPLEPPKAS